MDWQERLRSLDSKRSSGEITHEQWRRQHDDVIAEVSGNPKAITSQPAPDDRAESSVQPALPPATWTSEPSSEWSAAEGTRDMPRVVDLTSPADLTRPHLDGVALFTEVDHGSGKARALLAVLVIAVIGVGMWWFGLRTDHTGDTDPPATASHGEIPSTAPLDSLPLPGTANPDNASMALERAVQLELITRVESATLAEHGVTQIVFRGSTASGIGYTVVVARADPPSRARALTTALTSQLRSTGFTDGGNVAAGDATLPLLTRAGQTRELLRTVYQSGDLCVRIGVSGKLDGEAITLREEFARFVTGVTSALPVR